MNLKIPIEHVDDIKKILDRFSYEITFEDNIYKLKKISNKRIEVSQQNIFNKKNIDLTSIVYCYSDTNYVYCFDGCDYYRTDLKLYELEEYKSEGFVRINKSEVVNTNYIKRIRTVEFSRLCLEFKDDIYLMVNRAYKRKFEQFLERSVCCEIIK